MPAGYVEGAVVAGWSAHVIDVILSRELPRYLERMGPEHRAEVERAHTAIHRAATAGRTAADGNAAVGDAALVADSAHADELTVEEVADRLGVRRRQARNLAVRWWGDGLARKAGGAWLVDPVAVEQERRRRCVG